MLSLPGAIEVLQRRWDFPSVGRTETPIFVFAAGWRSGSTLLQRLLVSGGDTLIWGEPYTHADYIGMLADSLRMFTETAPPNDFFFPRVDNGNGKGIQEKWIAHLYPDPVGLRDAHRAFFQTLLGAPAASRGYQRWGLKECRYGIEHAIYLKWLFPNAKFIFVYRNPYHAYRSFRLFGAYMRWPDQPLFTARSFGRLWRTLLEGYLARYEEVDGMLIKYEDLVAGNVPIENLAAFAGVRCDAAVLHETVTGRGERRLEPVPLLEMRLLSTAVSPLAARIGYQP